MSKTKGKKNEKISNSSKKNEVQNNENASLLKDIELNNEIHVQLMLYKEYQYVDIRKFFNGRPTSKGIRFKKGIFDKMKEINFDKLEKTELIEKFKLGEKEYETKIIRDVELGDSVKLRLMLYFDREHIDIRRYFGNYPTKKGIRIEKSIYEKMLKIDFE
jgi:hypothetical protein